MTKFQEKHSQPAMITDSAPGTKSLFRGGQSSRQFKKANKKAKRMSKKDEL